MNIQATEMKGLQMRAPVLEDAQAIWKLVRESGVLDPNSTYAYLMACKHFSETSVVAVDAGKIIGFAIAFPLPRAADTLFIWQIGVDEMHRGKGMALNMIEDLLARYTSRHFTYLEATVSPNNRSSAALFKKVAKTFHTDCVTEECFPAQLFPDQQHEAEWTYRIGPLK